MFSLSEGLHYYLAVGSVDMRKGINTLSALVRNDLGRDPLSGEVFIFINGSRHTIKLLHWQRGGFVLYQKRLEKGTFELPPYNKNDSNYKMDWHTLVMLIEGIKIRKAYMRKRYEL